ncbi:MAG: class I SAM-dependent methyltransferase [Thermodesulfobacteriota bacterium]
MKSNGYEDFRGTWRTKRSAQSYKDRRFSSSRRWRWTDRRERLIVAQFLSSLPERALVLDIPCGAGRLAGPWVEANMDYVGADVSLSMLGLAREVIPGSSLLCADAGQLPFRAGLFDAVTAVRLLHRIRDRDVRVRMLKELARVTHGPILVTYYLRWNIRGVQRWLRGGYPGLTLRGIMLDACCAGLEVSRAVPLRRWTQQEWFFVLEGPS